MIFSRPFLVTCILSLLLPIFGIASGAENRVFVSILPQKFFVQQISGETLDVEVMVKPGANPATYEPNPSQMKKLASATAYFAIGVPFEKAWLPKIAGINPAMQIIHTDSTVEKIAMLSHHHEDDREEKHHEDHNGLDPHIWLAPPLVKKQAAIILAGLRQLFPDNSDLFQENYSSFVDRVDSLHQELQALLQIQRGKEFMVFHPSWGYFADTYGLTQVAIEIEGKNPKPAQLRKLIEHARNRNIDVIFAQTQFSTKNAEIIAREINGTLVLVDPLAENWFVNLRDTAQKFNTAAQ